MNKKIILSLLTCSFILVSGFSLTIDNIDYNLLASEKSYSLSFSNDNNFLPTSGTANMSVTTSEENILQFGYSGATKIIPGWMQLRKNGTFYNTSAISGIKKLSISVFAHCEIELQIGYVINGYRFTSGRPYLLNSTLGYEITFTDRPSYFKLISTNDNTFINSLNIEYSCDETKSIGDEHYFDYRNDGNGGYQFYSVLDKNRAVDYIIPNTINNRPVSKIGGMGFDKCTSLKSITLGDNVLAMNSRAFADCTNLTTVNLNKVTNIGYRAFYNDINLKSIVIPDSVLTIGGDTFGNCASLNNVIISKNVKTIPNAMFTDCISLESLIIPTGVTEIEGLAFGYCTKLSYLYLPETIETIGPDILFNSKSLTTINYGGTVDQMTNQIALDANWLRNSNVDTIICKDGRLTREL